MPYYQQKGHTTSRAFTRSSSILRISFGSDRPKAFCWPSQQFNFLSSLVESPKNVLMLNQHTGRGNIARGRIRPRYKTKIGLNDKVDQQVNQANSMLPLHLKNPRTHPRKTHQAYAQWGPKIGKATQKARKSHQETCWTETGLEKLSRR